MARLTLPPLLLFDGATGTALAQYGVDLSPPLWSARAMRDAPAALREVHEGYLGEAAGADVITTNTFRSNARAVAKSGAAGASLDWRWLTRRAVEIALEAREAVNREAIVLGSVAPVEDCYETDQAPDEAAAEREHGEMIEMLLGAGVDAILLETFGTIREARGAVRAARSLAPGRWMLSVLPKHGGVAGELFSGESMEPLLAEVEGALAIGINCLPADEAAMHLAWLGERVDRTSTRLLAYANTARCGADGAWKETEANNPARYAQHAASWLDAGATIIGGCCGTTPAHITALRELIDQRGANSPA